MRLTFRKFDGRGRKVVPIIDEETGRKVGSIFSEGVGTDRFGGMVVSLFGGKYRTTASRYDECVGFVNGVEAVLNHMIEIPPKRAVSEESEGEAA